LSKRGIGRGIGDEVEPTTGIDTRYAAVAVRAGPIAFVRVALPLTAIDARVASVRRLALVGLLAGLAAAVALIGLWSVVVNGGLRAVVDTAERYKAGDFTRPARDHGRDEMVRSRTYSTTRSRQLGTRLTEMARERAHMERSDRDGGRGRARQQRRTLVLTNPAVRSMLRLPEPAEDRHYLEVVRHPDIAAATGGCAGRAGRRHRWKCSSTGTPASFSSRTSCLSRARGRRRGPRLHRHHGAAPRRSGSSRTSSPMSHTKLRTPLTAIRGSVEALLDSPPDARGVPRSS
jgi:hypothetical protein